MMGVFVIIALCFVDIASGMEAMQTAWDTVASLGSDGCMDYGARQDLKKAQEKEQILCKAMLKVITDQPLSTAALAQFSIHDAPQVFEKFVNEVNLARSNCAIPDRDWRAKPPCDGYGDVGPIPRDAATNARLRKQQANIQPGMRPYQRVGASLDEISPKFSYTIVYIAAMVIFAFGFVVGRASLASAKNSVNMRLLDGEDIYPMA